MKNRKIILSAVIILLASAHTANAQTKKKERKKEFYFSWGYNKDYFTNSTVKVSQPSLGNNYSFENIKGHDHPGWNEDFFHKALSIPQYNYRIGMFINKEKGIAVEINFDHTKFIFTDQAAHVKGTMNNRPIDTTVNFQQPNFYYFLNNGANFLLFNIVKRWHFIATKDEKIKVDLLAKVGIGPVIPHVDNKLFGNQNHAGFQLGGWNAGVEGAVRATFFNYVYLEYCNKLDYARYSNLKVYEGTAKQAFGTYEMILNLGITFPVGSKIKK